MDALPTRKLFAGNLLDKAAKEAIDEGLKVISHAVESGEAYLGMTMDGYKTIGKQHFTGIVLHVRGDALPFDTLSSGDVHHAIQIAKETEEVIFSVQERTGLRVSSLCTDDAGMPIYFESMLFN